MKSFLLKVGVGAGVLGVIAIFGFFRGWFNPLLKDTPAEEMSNSVQLGAQSSYLVLSEFFAKQLDAFGLEFGDFDLTSDFLSIDTAGDGATVQILQNGEPFLTVFDLRLPDGMSYDDLLGSLDTALGDVGLEPAAFGTNSFYFLEDGLSTNIFAVGDEVFAFQFDAANFDQVRDFISSLSVLN